MKILLAVLALSLSLPAWAGFTGNAVGVDFSCEFGFKDNLIPELVTPTMSKEIEK